MNCPYTPYPKCPMEPCSECIMWTEYKIKKGGEDLTSPPFPFQNNHREQSSMSQTSFLAVRGVFQAQGIPHEQSPGHI